MARKGKPRKEKMPKRPRALRPADFVFPGEKTSYWTGVAGMAIVFIWLAIALALTLKNDAQQIMWHIPIEVLAYPILAVIIANILAGRPRKMQLKKAGRQARVMNTNYPELYKALARQASLLGMKTPPELYLVNDPMALIYSLPGGRGTIIASHTLREALLPEEFEALLAHEMAHIACKHVRMELAMIFIRHTNIAVKILLFPVALMTIMARAWSELIDYTADRGAFLLTLKPAVLNAALVKFAVAADPQASITREELQAYLDSQGDITTDSELMERHFRVAEFVRSQPGLRERIEQLREFPQTKQGQEAIAKAAELQGVPVPLMGAPAKRTEEEIEHIAADEDEPGIPGVV